MKKNILTLLDLGKDDFDVFFERAFELKAKFRKGGNETTLAGKTLGLLFDKPSTRTRVSFEAAMAQLGGIPIFISTKDTQMVRNEPIEDTARVLSRYLDGVAIRTYSQDLMEAFAKYSDIPVINALTDMYHPCQVLSDIMTVIEHKKNIENLKITWLGDGNNVAHSWICAAAVLGLNLYLGCPKEYSPNPEVLEKAGAKQNGAIVVTTDPDEAIEGADVVYTDVWVSMGQESDNAKKTLFQPYQINAEMMKKAAKDAIVMHCLPVHRGEEITADVLEGPQSVVWDQSENKMHLHKAVLDILMSQNTD